MNSLKNEDGQTVIEYIFLIAVISLIIFSLMSKIKKRMIVSDLSECGQTPLAPVCVMKNLFNPDIKFRYYPLRR